MIHPASGWSMLAAIGFAVLIVLNRSRPARSPVAGQAPVAPPYQCRSHDYDVSIIESC